MQPDGTCLKNGENWGLCVLSEWWDRPGTPEKHRREFGLDSVGDVEPLESFVQDGGMFIDCKLKRLDCSPWGKCS